MKTWLKGTLLAVWICGGSSLLAQAPSTPASLAPCPYSPAEIAATLGLAVDAGQAADMASPGGRDVGCLYPIKGSEVVLVVRQTWDPSVSTGSSAGKSAANGGPRVELSYSRGKVRTLISVHGGTFNETDMQPRLLKLRQVP
jgi:hypothetical protein